MNAAISVVTPTLGRPGEVAELIANLNAQRLRPIELILVDGAGPDDTRTQDFVKELGRQPEIAVKYIRRSGGTAVQRNAGIDEAAGDFIAFIDDDIRLEADFFERLVEVFESDQAHEVGGVAGYITNQHLDPDSSLRWRLYRRFRLFKTYEPGRYDYYVGYPINRYLQPPHQGVREIDFMGSNCALWRAKVFKEGLRFDEFFSGFGVLEDAHLALRARQIWKLLECGKAHCVHLRSPSSRERAFSVARKTAVNYRYVFMSVVPERTLAQEVRFFIVQLSDLAIVTSSCVRGGGSEALKFAAGKVLGILQALLMRSETSAPVRTVNPARKP